jgi:hypothetical protein
MIVTAHARDDLGKADFDEIFSGKTMSGPLTYLEKPVKPESFLNHVERVLGLEPSSDAAADDAARLRRQIESRLDELDADTLRRLARTLERGPGGG